MYKIIKKEVLSANLQLMEIEAPLVARNAKAGQFIILRVDEQGERIPLTIADFDNTRGTITIIFAEVGYSTQKLGKMKVGDSVQDFVGPLGHESEIKNFGTVVCIGGGVGVAPMFPITRELKQAGNEVISIIGARCKDLLFWEDEMRAVSDVLYVTSDDGTVGAKGLVTDPLKQLIAEGKKIDIVYAIGPLVMMRAVAEATRTHGLKTIVSLNSIMVDGTGMCGACRVTVGEETKFACVDGPEFDAHLVDFNEQMRRSKIFADAEKRALAAGSCGGGCGCH
jgi:ferredoxin--NADP+ reductase